MHATGVKCDVVSYNTLISACANANDCERAAEWLREMDASGMAPNVVSYTALINAWAQANRPEKAAELLRVMSVKEVEPNVVTFNVCLNAWSRAKQPERACELMEALRVWASEGGAADGGPADTKYFRRPTDRLRARAVQYVDFAVEHPELFRLMFQYRPVEVAIEVDNELAAATSAFERLLTDIHQAIDDGRLPRRHPVELAIMLWSAIHGVATVAMMMPGAPHENLAGGVIDAMLAGLRPG